MQRVAEGLNVKRVVRKNGGADQPVPAPPFPEFRAIFRKVRETVVEAMKVESVDQKTVAQISRRSFDRAVSWRRIVAILP
jgi:hypothetical protein